jgi:spoIIIJ-associated protein
MKTKKAVKEAKPTDRIEVVNQIVNDLLKLMGTNSEATTTEDKEQNMFLVDVKSEQEKGLLIGRYGDTLTSIQSIASLIAREKFGEWVRIVVNIGDWREKEEDRLKALAKQAAERALETGEQQSLYNLNSTQRRIVHLELAENPKVVSESQGEGKDRFLVVSPKQVSSDKE